MPLPDRIRCERQARHDRRMTAAAQIVPHGPYCYSHTGNMRLIERQGQIFSVPERKPCPYLKLRQARRRQQNGYCRLLKAGDYSQGRTVRCFSGTAARNAALISTIHRILLRRPEANLPACRDRARNRIGNFRFLVPHIRKR